MQAAKEPLFSVVIPLYNKADTIERTIRSVAAQTCRDFELIVVNDGSTDGSLGIVKTLSAEFPLRIVDKPNGGVSSARNAGAKVSLGEFIALLDGDDIWLPTHLESMQRMVRRYPDIGMFGGGYERVDGDRLYYTIPWGCTRVDDVYSLLTYAQPFNSSTVVIRRKLWLDAGGFDTRYSFYEDFEFFFRLGFLTKCAAMMAISARYTSDATIQATKGKREFTRLTRPHLALIDDSIAKGVATSGMMKYARTQVRLAESLYVLGKSDVTMQHFAKCFPNVASLISARKCRGANGTCRLLALGYLSYFKLRNHMIIWKKKAHK